MMTVVCVPGSVDGHGSETRVEKVHVHAQEGEAASVELGPCGRAERAHEEERVADIDPDRLVEGAHIHCRRHH